MGYMGVTLKFGLGIEDSYKWTAEDQAALEACEVEGCNGSDKHAEHLMADVLFAAGEKFLAEHPGMYRVFV